MLSGPSFLMSLHAVKELEKLSPRERMTLWFLTRDITSKLSTVEERVRFLEGVMLPYSNPSQNALEQYLASLERLSLIDRVRLILWHAHSVGTQSIGHLKTSSRNALTRRKKSNGGTNGSNERSSISTSAVVATPNSKTGYVQIS